MLRGMPFATIHEALSWFFNRPWKRAGNYARSNWPDGERIQSSCWQPSVAEVAAGFLRIGSLLAVRLTARDISVVAEHYRRRGATQAEVALDHGITERGVRWVRDRVITKLEPEFIAAGIVRPPKPGEPRYARDEGDGAVN